MYENETSITPFKKIHRVGPKINFFKFWKNLLPSLCTRKISLYFFEVWPSLLKEVTTDTDDQSYPLKKVQRVGNSRNWIPYRSYFWKFFKTDRVRLIASTLYPTDRVRPVRPCVLVKKFSTSDWKNFHMYYNFKIQSLVDRPIICIKKLLIHMNFICTMKKFFLLGSVMTDPMY